MPMVCPKCTSAFDQHVQCPTCRVRLQFTPSTAQVRHDLLDESRWQQTSLGRIAIGLLLAQGMALGLRLCFDASLLVAAAEENRDGWSALMGMLVLQGVQGICILLGSALAGAGRRNGYFIGGCIGFLNCAILMGIAWLQGNLTFNVELYGQPILQTVIGILGGLTGSLIWRPLPSVAVAVPMIKKKRPEFSPASLFFSGKIDWIKVLLGTAVAIAGVISANYLLGIFLTLGGGDLQVTSQLQSRLLTWEIGGLAVLLGSGIAGFNVFNGPKQGLCVGILCAVTLGFLELSTEQTMLEEIVFVGLCILGLSIVGGWFSCRLFPPVVAVRKRLSSDF